MTKKLISAIILIIFATILSGCATVEYKRTISPNGQVVDRLNVQINTEGLVNPNALDQLVTQIRTDLDNNFLKPVRDFKLEFMADPLNTAEAKSSVLNGIKPNVDYFEGSNLISATIVFDSLNLFDVYMASFGDSNGNEPVFEEGLFYNKSVQTTQNAFSVVSTETVQNMFATYESYFKTGFGYSSLTFIQRYESPDNNLQSNADLVEVNAETGTTTHTWQIDANNTDYSLEYFYTSPNVSTWYILALVIAIFTAFILLGIVRKNAVAYKGEFVDNDPKQE